MAKKLLAVGIGVVDMLVKPMDCVDFTCVYWGKDVGRRDKE